MQIVTLSFLLIAALVPQLMAENTINLPTIGEIVRVDSKLDQLVGPDARIEVLASGFDWSEGPVWVPRDGGYLLFSDVPQNTIFKWQAGKGITIFLKPSGFTGVGSYSSEPGSNGLALDREGRLICCEHGDRRISVMPWGEGKRTLASNWEGKWFNSPNDVACRSNGDVYFTDPPYGLPSREPDEVQGYGGCGVFRIANSGEVSLLTREMTRPNGIAFSPDEKTLYVAQSDSSAPIIRAFDVNDDGTVGNSRIFYDVSSEYGKQKGSPDGMTIDTKGNLFATGPGGVHVITPDGKLLGRIDTGEATANCTWGDDGSVLYITADMYLCRVQTRTKGIGW
ncbi:SMP-30/gluconolactonase/LRE family protein [Bythopirellula polymerisocia]|uniref:Gluconolactonase n=1 Tax=Bythopirellula polymerisocia TaxID=2528003 RepID=A0A5C6CUH3_9BACT|nr:SMP-30/gluconolactonase/LRE family protein [Bythopirellula polymerisocia]TWU27304.1 Gluconolactonase precursor [Bythopirellula polymerisocia]